MARGSAAPQAFSSNPAHTPLTGEGHGDARVPSGASSDTVATTTRRANTSPTRRRKGAHVPEEVHMAMMAVAFPIIVTVEGDDPMAAFGQASELHDFDLAQAQAAPPPELVIDSGSAVAA